MIELVPAKGGAAVKVTFVVLADHGRGRASVVGDFNHWDPAATPLRARGGHLRATVRLAPGQRYAFRYLAEDGRWFNDEAADDYQPNAHGGSDSVVDLTAL